MERRQFMKTSGLMVAGFLVKQNLGYEEYVA